MHESWRTYISFMAAGMIFVLCQVLAGSSSGPAPTATSDDPGDRTYTARDETSGPGGLTLASVRSAPSLTRAVQTPRTAVGESRQSTD